MGLWELDKKLFLLINGLGGSWLDYLFGWTTFLGTAFLFYLVFIFMLIWDPEKIARKFLMVLAAGTCGSLLASLLKSIISRPRPYDVFYQDIAQGRVVVNSIFSTVVSNSFPSGHAALVFATVVALNIVYKNRLLFLYPLAAVVAVSRIYVGAHFPSDVMGGALLGVIASLLFITIIRKYLPIGRD